MMRCCWSGYGTRHSLDQHEGPPGPGLPYAAAAQQGDEMLPTLPIQGLEGVVAHEPSRALNLADQIVLEPDPVHCQVLPPTMTMASSTFDILSLSSSLSELLRPEDLRNLHSARRVLQVCAA
jgi:hypothetical protein